MADYASGFHYLQHMLSLLSDVLESHGPYSSQKWKTELLRFDIEQATLIVLLLVKLSW